LIANLKSEHLFNIIVNNILTIVYNQNVELLGAPLTQRLDILLISIFP
jgi:hypothetical protein